METTTKYEVREIAWREKTFITKRAKISFDKLSTFFTETYGAIYDAIKRNGIVTTEEPYAIYYSVDDAKNETDLAAAVAVPGTVKKIEGFQNVTIPDSKALTITYYGSYENMGPVYAALDKYVAEHGLKKEWMLEEYFSDPAVEKDPARWKTNIYFIVK